MDATIAICTWNRAELLDQTLTRLQQLTIPTGLAWEVVVVNNRCTDKTDEVIARHCAALPLRRISEEKRGLSRARNAALQAAQGELILWTDDDVLVDPSWLAETVAAARANPAVSFFGGPIEPWFECPPPDWLARNWRQFSTAYAIRDFGAAAFAFDAARLPFGANYAVRRAAQLAFPYDHRLGRNGSKAIGGEETQVLRQMLAAGHHGQWVPTAKVRHFLPRKRLTLAYVQRFYHGVGQTEMIRAKRPRKWQRWSRRCAARIGAAWFAALDALPISRGKTWAKALIRSSQRQGREDAYFFADFSFSTRWHSSGVIMPSPSRSNLRNSAATCSDQLVAYSTIETWPSPSVSPRRNQSGIPFGSRSVGERKR